MDLPTEPPLQGALDEPEPLRAGAGVGARDARALLEVTGADRVRFLHGYLTCDVKGLAVGRVVYGFFTARDGKLLADAWVGALGEALVLSLPAARAEAIVEHLSRYVLTDRVAFRRCDELAALHLLGPAAGALLLACGLAAPERDGIETLARGAGSWIVLRRDLGAVAGFELWIDAGERETAAATLAAGGAAPVEPGSFETLRVEEGVPRFGVDFDVEHFPQETGLEEQAVSYSKGCYLGQEVVARIHYRGGVQRELHALCFPGPPPEPGTAVLHDGREAGRVTSVARSLRYGAIGLAVLHRRVGEPPGELTLAGGGVARLVMRPFAGVTDLLAD